MPARNHRGGNKREIGKTPARGGPSKKQNTRNTPARHGRDGKQQNKGSSGNADRRSPQARAGTEAVYQAVLAVVFLATLIAALAVVDNSWVRASLGSVALLASVLLLARRDRTVSNEVARVLISIFCILALLSLIVTGKAVVDLVRGDKPKLTQATCDSTYRTERAFVDFISPFASTRIGVAPVYVGDSWKAVIDSANDLLRDAQALGSKEYLIPARDLVDNLSALTGSQSSPSAGKPYSAATENLFQLVEICDNAGFQSPMEATPPSAEGFDVAEVCDGNRRLLIALGQKGQDGRLSELERNDLRYASATISTFAFDAAPAAKGAADQLAALTKDLINWIEGRPLAVDDVRRRDAALQSICSTSRFPVPKIDWQATSRLLFTV
jgi:hypothetical protein